MPQENNKKKTKKKNAFCFQELHLQVPSFILLSLSFVACLLLLLFSTVVGFSIFFCYFLWPQKCRLSSPFVHVLFVADMLFCFVLFCCKFVWQFLVIPKYRVRHLTFFLWTSAYFISMVTLSSCLIWQIISFMLPPNEYA